MARLSIPYPQALLGRHVKGTYLCGGVPFSFNGIVEAVNIPMPRSRHFKLEMYVSGEFITVEDCTALDFL